MLSKEEIVKCLNDIIDKYYEKISTIGEDDYNEDLDDICCDINELIEKIEDGIATNDYYRGYNERDKLAREICKKCEYRKKAREIESREQKLIKKLEEEKKKNNEFEFMPLQAEQAYNNYYKLGKINEIDEILKILKGENK